MAFHGNLKLILISFVAAFGSMFQFGYQGSVINPSVQALTNFFNASYEENHGHPLDENTFTWIWSLVVNCFQIGYLIGTILTPYCVEKFGRKWVIVGSGPVDIVGAALEIISFVTSVPALFAVGRLIIGVGSGLSCGAVTLYIQEISPTKVRGLLSSFQAVSTNVTALLAMVLALPAVLGNSVGLPYLMGFAAVAGFMKLTLIPCPETPKFLLIKRNQPDNAYKAIRFYHGSKTNVDEVLTEMRKEGVLSPTTEKYGSFDDNAPVDQTTTSASALKKFIQILTVAYLRKALLLGCACVAALNFTGMIPIAAYSTVMLTTLGTNENFAFVIGVVMLVCFTITAIISCLLVDIVGRKKLLLFNLVAIAGLLTILMSCYFVELSRGKTNWLEYFAGATVVVLTSLFALGPGNIPWYITAELVPQSVRSTAQSTVQVVNVLINFGVTFSFYPAFIAGPPYCILGLFIIPTVLLIVVLYFELPETKNREIVDIIADLKK